MPDKLSAKAPRRKKFKVIHTSAAPSAIGTYSQAVAAGDIVYLSGQIGLDPATGQTVAGGVEAELHQVFRNLTAVAAAAGGGLDDIVKLTVYLTDLSCFQRVNEIMAGYFTAPYPARAAVEVKALPRGVAVEVDAIMWLGD